MAISPALLERVTPPAAGWFAGEDVHDSYYGAPVRLASDARRLDTSPAWFPWVGTVPALRTVRDIGVETIEAVMDEVAASLAEADRMTAAVARAGKLLAINWPLAWVPAHRAARRPGRHRRVHARTPGRQHALRARRFRETQSRGRSLD